MFIINAWKKLKRTLTEFDYRTLKNMGIGKTLLLWFLVISLIPLATLSYINFLYYYQGLNVMAKKSLFTTSQLRMNYMNSYFQDMTDYLEDVARDHTTIMMFEGLQQNYSQDIKDNEPLPASAKWAALSDELRTNIQKTYMPEGITNIYFINSKGIILFELNDGQDLGKELFTGPLSSTSFGKTSYKIMKGGEPLFSDLEYYPPANNELCGFLGMPVLNTNGAKLGIVAVRISTEKIDKIIQFGIGFGSTGHVYLVGTDLKLRSASKVGDKSKILIETEENDKTRIWQGVKINNIILDPDGKTIAEEVSIYKNSKGKYVICLLYTSDAADE